MADLTFDKEEEITIRASFTRTSDGELADPDIVRFRYIAPGSAEVIKVFGTDPEIVKEATGIYSMPVAISDPGLWYWRIDDGGSKVADEGEFHVRLSLFS